MARELKKLQWNMSDMARPNLIDQMEKGDEEEVTQAQIGAEDSRTKEGEANIVFSATVTSDPGTPKSVKEALKGAEKEKWTASGVNEVMNFMRRKAWKKVKQSYVEQVLNRRAIRTKTVFKVKHEADGSLRYKTRIVSKNYQ
jgi:hypothetical protein